MIFYAIYDNFYVYVYLQMRWDQRISMSQSEPFGIKALEIQLLANPVTIPSTFSMRNSTIYFIHWICINQGTYVLKPEEKFTVLLMHTTVTDALGFNQNIGQKQCVLGFMLNAHTHTHYF